MADALSFIPTNVLHKLYEKRKNAALELIEKAREYFGLSDLEKRTQAGGILHVHIGDALSPIVHDSRRYAGGLAVAAAALAGKYGIQPTMTRREAVVILGVRYVSEQLAGCPWSSWDAGWCRGKREDQLLCLELVERLEWVCCYLCLL